MNIQIKSFLIVLALLIISCKNHNKENEMHDSNHDETITETIPETKIEESEIDQTKIIEQLQGKWKEIEYPYRTAEFVDSTVIFIEEGTQNKPIVQQFELSRDCPFENNNIRDLKSDDLILSLPETTRCEKLIVSNDTLTLNGFSTNTNKDYTITYLKLKK